MNTILRALLPLMLALCFETPCFAQSDTSGTAKQQDDELRAIVPERFVKARPRKSRRATRTRVTYKRVTPGLLAESQASQSGVSRYAQLGLTIWRLRESVSKDGVARVRAQEGSGSMEWTPIRVDASKPLTVGDLVRFSIESSVEGYLYVLDRGQYADGTMSEPHLIFPTTRTRGGDNSVKPGRLIEIPAQTDQPNYFRLKASRSELIAELLTIIVSKEPIAGLAEQIGSRPLALDKDLVAKWEHTWAGRVEHFELAGGEGKPWTKAEQDAGADATRELTQDDAPPQTIFRLVRKPGAPMLVNVELRILRSAALAP